MKKRIADIEVAMSAARKAGEYLRGVPHPEPGNEKVKESRHSIVTQEDLEAQKIIVTTLREADPHARILSEEKIAHEYLSAPFWVVDPIDGTSYFVRGLPSYSISIAFVDDRGVAAGVVHCPATNELFHAERGRGAFLNGNRISVSRIDDPKKALFTFSHRFLREITSWPGRLDMVRSVRSIRAGGSCAQDLAYLANGNIDGITALSQSAWDYAAGMLLVTEAGGEVTDLAGRKLNVTGDGAKSQDLVATNSRLHAWCLELIAPREADR